MHTLKDINLTNKTVLVRVDYNVPVNNGVVINNYRIKESLQTINYLINNNCKIILLSHMGKIKTKEDKEDNTLLPVKNELSKLLNKDILFSNDFYNLKPIINSMNYGDILLVENTRYLDIPNNLESGCNLELSKYFASLCDVFVLDAFASSHRPHASTYGVSKFAPHYIGFLIEKELTELNKIKNENKTLLLGGAKASDKIKMIKNLLPKTDKCLIGGSMCATFLKSLNYNVGKTNYEEELIDECKELINTGKIILPIDIVCENGVKEVDNINNDDTILDIGPKTVEKYISELNGSNLILMNGTMGKYEIEEYSNGTKSIFEYLKGTNKKVVVCGGDSVSACEKYNFNPSYKSTGGGASLEYLEGKTLEPLQIMEE